MVNILYIKNINKYLNKTMNKYMNKYLNKSMNKSTNKSIKSIICISVYCVLIGLMLYYVYKKLIDNKEEGGGMNRKENFQDLDEELAKNCVVNKTPLEYGSKTIKYSNKTTKECQQLCKSNNNCKYILQKQPGKYSGTDIFNYDEKRNCYLSQGYQQGIDRNKCKEKDTYIWENKDYVENVDCILGEWGPWSKCKKCYNYGENPYSTQYSKKKMIQPAKGNGKKCGAMNRSKKCKRQMCTFNCNCRRNRGGYWGTYYDCDRGRCWRFCVSCVKTDNGQIKFHSHNGSMR